MSHSLTFVIFFSVLIFILIAIHYFIGRTLIRTLEPDLFQKRWLKIFLIFMGASAPLSLISTRVFHVTVPLIAVFLTWIGFALLLTVFLAISSLSLKIQFFADRSPDPSRRRFLTKSSTLTALTAAGGAGAYGINVAVNPPIVKELNIQLKKWPKALDGFKIVQVTDLHVGVSIRKPYVEAVAQIVNSLNADLIALTGDFVDGSVEELSTAVASLAGLRSKHGSFFVTGNHEYYSGVEQWLPKLSAMGIRPLRNESVVIEQNGARFQLAGVDDYNSKGLAEGHGFDLRQATKNLDPALATVLMAHQPRGCFEAFNQGVDLQLSGHTHGGQIWPFGLLVGLIQPYVRGLHQKGDSYIYVSCGTGFWGPTMRVGAPSEVTLVKIYSPQV